MSTATIRKVLAIALFVFFSAVLFVLLLPAVLAGIGVYAQHHAIGGEFLYPIWTAITASLAVALTAGVSLLIALAVRRLTRCKI